MALKLPKHWPVQILEHTVLQLTSRRLWRASIYKFINMTCVWECSKMWCNASKELDPTCSISVVSVWSFVGFVGSAWHSSLGSNHFNFRCNTWMVSLVTLFKTKNDQIAGKKYCRVARCRSISEFILGSLLWPFGCWIALRGQRQRPDLSEFYPQWTEFFVNLWILMFFKKKRISDCNSGTFNEAVFLENILRHRDTSKSCAVLCLFYWTRSCGRFAGALIDPDLCFLDAAWPAVLRQSKYRCSF